MGMKSQLGMYAAFAALAATNPGMGMGMHEEPVYVETEEDKKKRLAQAQIEINKANGLTEFFYGENSVWALNKRTADKKARKLNYIV